MTDTPETTAAVIASDGQWSFALKQACAQLERERDQWRSESLEQAKLLAMSADREEKLRMELQQARDCFSAAMELAQRYKAERDATP